MLASFRQRLENYATPEALAKLFLKEWDSPTPTSKGVCFPDLYLNEHWDPAPKSPANDCSLMLDYPFYYEQAIHEDSKVSLQDFRERLRIFLQSLYYENEPGFQIKLYFMHAAFQKAATGKMIFQVGHGGDGKGMEAILDRALFGPSCSSTLDCGVFLDRMEFRKSAELAWNKANIRVQEMDKEGRFIADLWKRFVVDEEIDCRINYGFTSKRKIGRSMQAQELNYENIPIIEESSDRKNSCEHTRRRIVCLRMGRATWTGDKDAVDHNNGVYQLIPQEELQQFLSHPVTTALYLREWCIPFFKQTSQQECLRMINYLEDMDSSLAQDRDWLAARLSGGSAPPPDDIADMTDQANQLVAAVHAETPWHRVIRACLLHKCECLPGEISSTKNKRTKLFNFFNFTEAVDSATSILFKQVDAACFHKLLVDWPRLVAAMQREGGDEVFGNWKTWGNAFDILRKQERWDGAAFDMEKSAISAHSNGAPDIASMSYRVVCTLTETVDLDALMRYAGTCTNRRPERLARYVQRHVEQEVCEGSLSTINVEYYRKPPSVRLLARGPAGQKLTREACSIAFGSHCAEIDAECCHPRLLQKKLMDLNLWTDEKFPMLDRFVKHFRHWRVGLAMYQDYSIQDAKIELIRIFYGGKPTIEAPFLLKLGDEVQEAARSLLRHSCAADLVNMYTDRRNPEFSRLSALLSKDEAAMLDKARLVTAENMQVLIFDGGLVRDDSVAAEVAIMKAVASNHQHGVPLSGKTWSRDSTTVAQVFLRSEHVACKDCPHMIQRYGNCLLNAIASANSDCALSGWEPDLDSPAFDLSAEFNTSMIYDSQRDSDATYRLVHENTADLQFYAKKSGQWICHQQLSKTDGHWCAVCFTSDWKVHILDPAAGSVMLSIQLDRLSAILPDMVSLLTWFRLAKVLHEENLQMDGPYALRGAGLAKPSCSVSSSKRMEIVIPLISCVECQAPLAPAHIVPGRLYGLTGVQAIPMVTKR